jgi:hypothetical protein
MIIMIIHVYLKRRISIFTLILVILIVLELKHLKYLFNKKYKIHLKKRND